MITRELVARTILETIAARLASIALEDPALQSLTFTVHLRAGGGWPRAIVTRVEASDDLMQGNGGYVDACGPVGRRPPRNP